MNYRYLMVIAGFSLLLLLGVGCARQAPAKSTQVPPQAVASATLPIKKRYDLQSAKIVYRLSGDFGTGRETLYLTDWGRHEARVTETDAEPSATSSKSITVSDELRSYSFGTADNDGVETAVDKNSFWQESDGDFSFFMASRLDADSYKKTGESVAAGKDCEVWKHETLPLTQCIWKGVVLRIESKSESGEKSIYEAEQIEENATVPNSVFVIPPQIKFRSVTAE